MNLFEVRRGVTPQYTLWYKYIHQHANTTHTPHTQMREAGGGHTDIDRKRERLRQRDGDKMRERQSSKRERGIYKETKGDQSLSFGAEDTSPKSW